MNGILNLATIFITSIGLLFTSVIVILTLIITFVKLFFTFINIIFKMARGDNDKKQAQDFISGKGPKLFKAE